MFEHLFTFDDDKRREKPKLIFVLLLQAEKSLSSNIPEDDWCACHSGNNIKKKYLHDKIAWNHC